MKYFNEIITVFECDSTMDLAKKLKNFFNPPFVLQSNIQRFGRGQYGRSWNSNFGGLYFTEVLSLEQILGFSTFLSIPIIRVLKRYVNSVKVKWPNDIVVGRKKLGGILIEKSDYVYAGIGINVSNKVSEEFKKISARLSDFSEVNELHLFYEILDEEENLINEFLRNGFKNFVNEYNENLIFLNDEIELESNNIYRGIVEGVGIYGELILKTRDKVERIFSGTVLNFYE
ncbi:MAG: biotin--[acetyl-CoA-carboxylase] ligase [Caldisericum sp.]|uniref:Biotin--[acetyl-CoA-carboxylase] ligase n=1 Tax=Caldisericum exile TaxID=693075 RepID=A0A2J6X446_9BACT|nr:MAG: biotin--[acetyl-CoA-carboxylase] ligase [Caldisericum exile]